MSFASEDCLSVPHTGLLRKILDAIRVLEKENGKYISEHVVQTLLAT